MNRSATPIVLALVATMVSGPLNQGFAAERIVSDGWTTVDANGIFSFSLPPGMEPHPVQGQDTYVGEYHSSAIRLSFIYGLYGIDLCEMKYADTKPLFGQALTDIDGRRARVITFDDPDRTHETGFPYVAAVCFDDLGADVAGQKTKLDMWAYCRDRSGQEVAKEIFRSISIRRSSSGRIK